MKLNIWVYCGTDVESIWMYVSGAEVLAMPYVNWKPKVLLVSLHTRILGTRGEAKGGQRLKDREKVQCKRRVPEGDTQRNSRVRGIKPVLKRLKNTQRTKHPHRRIQRHRISLNHTSQQAQHTNHHHSQHTRYRRSHSRIHTQTTEKEDDQRTK